MNLMRTIRRDEKAAWIRCMFDEATDEDYEALEHYLDDDPMRLPFPFKLKEDVTGGFAYLVYRGHIIGYQKIVSVREQLGGGIGSDSHYTRAGEEVLLSGYLERSPKKLKSVRLRGFTGIRYTPKDLHKLSAAGVRAALKKAGIEVYE